MLIFSRYHNSDNVMFLKSTTNTFTRYWREVVRVDNRGEGWESRFVEGRDNQFSFSMLLVSDHKEEGMDKSLIL